ncbi:BMP family ABC transporter substrate-binding protein [Acrocarpospora corrugata]|uniref:BMP family ABC transporter substrate-binding protein n=1 Tax=Acrocarpospora corrugata TaxID=35763 RepID=A0A5M3VTL4_9ACTN|nr:BMP family ABC transporter substrate-binding protein [Acrocarpospora corrugata]GER98070.1 BMP family ABC transporter substrate-binding protein [Acrocarpospora corrugata]
MRKLAALAALLTVPLIACSANTTGTATTGTTSASPGKDSTAVGFIFVGPKDDFGYNQAAYQGSQEVAKAYPNLEVITAENVPEDDNAARVMNSMIAKGAKIIFATSYGHLDAALKVAAEHPDVAVVQQGNLITTAVPKNAGTFFGTVYEPVYLAGIAAGKATKSGKLGYVYAFPITQTIDNINAFELGAQSVNPAAQTFAVSTSSWCDPAKQAEAAANLLKQGVDVITQHQDCTATVIKATEAAGAFTVGYHADASAIAPKGWLTGSQWNWGPLYTDIVKTALGGGFTGSKYNDNFRVGYRTGENPFVQSPYGPLVDAETKAAIEKARDLLKTSSPFAGPVTDQEGKVRIPAGTVPDYTTIEKIDYFVAGVVGTLPKS